jgi:CHAT domain-containing protein
MGCAQEYGLEPAAADGNKKEIARVLIAPAAIAAFLSSAGCHRVDQWDPPAPTIEYATELKVGGKYVDLKRDLRPGTYVVEVRERDLDIVAHVACPAFRATLADDVRRHGLLATVVRLDETAAIRLRLENADHATKSGFANIRVLRLSANRTPHPDRIELAYAAFGAAGEQTARDDAPGRARAVELLHEAIAHFAAAGDVAAVAQSQYTLANLEYLRRNQWREARDAAEAAQKSFELMRDAQGLNNALTTRAAIELEIAATMDGRDRVGQERLFARADQALQATARYFHDHGLAIREAYAVNMRGVNLYYQGRYADAAATFAQASALAHANHDVAEELKSRGNEAAIRFTLGHAAEAAREYEAIVSLCDPVRQPYQYAVNRMNLGTALSEVGDFDRALAEFTEAIDRFAALDQPNERAVALGSLGRTYLRMGYAERALSTLLTAAAEEHRIGDSQAEATTKRSAGSAASLLGRHSEALRLLRDSLESTVGPTKSDARVLIAGELRMTGDYRGAEAELTRAFVGATEWTRASALEERGSLRLAQGSLVAAVADLRAADGRFADLGLEFNRINTQTLLSQALLRAGDVDGAARAADLAIAIERRIREKSANPEWRARFLAARYAPYEARIDAHLASREPDATLRAWRAFQVAEEVRARSLADHLSRPAAMGARARDVAADELRLRLTTLSSRLESSVRDPEANPAKTLELKNQVTETRARLEKRLNETNAVSAHDPAPADSIDQARKSIPPDTAVLGFFAGTESTHVWLLTHDRLRHSVAPGGLDLERLVREFVSDLQTSTAQARRAKLARSLLGGILDEITETRLLVLPDGPLNSLPFAALPVPGGKTEELLIDRFTIATAPSLQLATAPPRDGAPRRSLVAIVSDPVFTSTDRRLLAGRDDRAAKYRGSESLTRLPYSAVEARAVRVEFDPADAIDLSGFDATVSRVLELKSRPLRVLHFATHAEARRDSPELSVLYLTRFGSDGGRLARDRLTADDIMTSGLRADIVVLSGCATGAGDELRGEGVLGLTYGFLANGSNAVVASLWQIEDASTAKFMEKFYAAYRETGSAADALRIAQRDARRTSGTPMWSSFVVRANAFP